MKQLHSKIFPHTKAHSLFHSTSFNKTRSHKQQKMSNITTEKKDLKQLTDNVHSFTFNSKLSNIVGDYYSIKKQ